jgi:ribosomal protein S18 acetylase RimI-like enzyme
VQCITHEAGARVSVAVKIQAVPAGDRELFLQMAERHLRDLNPAFTPHPDWREHYFNRIQSNANLHLGWILLENLKAGFILYGLENHKFLPRSNGVIYELYVKAEFRHKGVGRAAALQAISDLSEHHPSKIQIELVEGNSVAEAFWKAIGFNKVSSRYVLSGEAK